MLQGKDKKRKIPRSDEASITHGAPSSMPAAHKHQPMPKHHKWCRRPSDDAQSITCDEV